MKQRQLYQRQKKANWSNDNIYKNHNALETDRTEGGHSADCANVNQKDSIHFYLTWRLLVRTLVGYTTSSVAHAVFLM